MSFASISTEKPSHNQIPGAQQSRRCVWLDARLLGVDWFPAVKAITAAQLALASDGVHRVTLDEAIEAMRLTAADMSVSRTGLVIAYDLTSRDRSNIKVCSTGRLLRSRI